MNLDEREEIIDLFDKYKNLLTQSQKQCLHLYLMEDLSLKEVAEIQATSRQAVHDAIKKGEKKLRSIAKKMNAE